MNSKSLSLFVLLLLPAAAAAASFPAAFIERQLGALGLDAPPSFEVPASPAPAAAVPAAATLFTEALWSGLAAPDAATLAALGAKVASLDAKQVRVLTWEALEPLLAQAAAQKMTVLDFFTDDGLRGPRVYHMPRALLAQLDKAYDLNSVFLISGKTVEGDDFHMTDAVVGGGRAVMLYDRDGFTYAHPVYKKHGGEYTLASVVTETINGPGDVGITGLTGWLGIAVQGIVRTGATDVDIITAFGATDSYLYPIAKRP